MTLSSRMGHILLQDYILAIHDRAAQASIISSHMVYPTREPPFPSPFQHLPYFHVASITACRRPLESGDIINIDITVFYNNYHGDTSQTFLVGPVDGPGRHLVSTTLSALHAGIQACGPGRPFKGIGRAIVREAEKGGVSVSSQFTGHGIGKVFHRPPWILHDGMCCFLLDFTLGDCLKLNVVRLL